MAWHAGLSKRRVMSSRAPVLSTRCAARPVLHWTSSVQSALHEFAICDAVSALCKHACWRSSCYLSLKEAVVGRSDFGSQSGVGGTGNSQMP